MLAFYGLLTFSRYACRLLWAVVPRFAACRLGFGCGLRRRLVSSKRRYPSLATSAGSALPPRGRTIRTCYAQLQAEDRVSIASLAQQGFSIRATARIIKRSASTVGRELARNSNHDNGRPRIGLGVRSPLAVYHDLLINHHCASVSIH